jgi:peptidylprolyl isomerase
MWRHLALVPVLVLALVGCRLKEEEEPTIAPPADVAAPPADALRTESGLASKVLSIGFSNVRPGPRSMVRVHYTGWTTDGEMFDSSVASGQPATFTVDQVIPGWTEGLQLMVVGEKRRFWIPGHLAYDNAPDPPPGMAGPPKGMLVFDVELLDVR